MTVSDQTQNRRSQKSVTVRVKLCDFLSKLSRENDFDMPIPAGCTAADFIQHLTQRLGNDFRKALLDRDGKPHPDYAIVINTDLIPAQQLADYSIKENSKLSIIPIAGGG
ncbi:MAG: MoaD/ThiS family protein [Desulfobacterales bacterium]|jgi:sulfur carrier protein ThiS